ncbi:DNA-binding protein [Klebsiella pasteurii]|uniref:DNA-binding protein n=2 Tax=Klebsiella pasteurii TaxID=2587529 RepID=UPI00287BF2B9|nr:DNA-binding protein [Klebsiella pasteurii]MDS7877495.1 DNA-binding protein [Klebsiella pasteurii]
MKHKKVATCYTEQRRAVRLGKLIKSGGAGSVYFLADDPDRVAKIYHPHTDTGYYQRKLGAMLAQRPEIPAPTEDEAIVQLAWPDYLLFDERRRVVGFVMPVLDTQRTIELEYILQARQAKAQNLPEGIGAKVSLACNLATLVSALHARQHRVIDMKPINLRFYRDSLYIALLDCDGFSIQGVGERFPAGQFTADYLAPEFQRIGQVPGEQEEAQDRFSLAVIIFQLLNHGIHPYSGRSQTTKVPDDLPGRIGADCYAYGINAAKNIAPVPASTHHLLPLELRKLFDRAFSDSASRRPSADEWAQVLRPYALRSTQKIILCSQKHQHFAGMPCLVCAREKQLTEGVKQAKLHKRTQTIRPRPAPVKRQPHAASAAAVPRQPAVPGPLTLLWRNIRGKVPSFVWHGALALISTLVMAILARNFTQLSGPWHAWYDNAALILIFVWITVMGLLAIFRSKP